MQKTKIEWVRNQDGTQGFTCNPKSGCLNLCPYCYARKLANGRLKSRYLDNHDVAPIQIVHTTLHDEDGWRRQKAAYVTTIDPFYPRWWPEKLDQIRARKKPAGIFLDDMSDWAADYWPEEWTRQEFETIRACPQHRFYLLTKQPDNLPKWSPFPSNCWVGVSWTGDDKARPLRSFPEIQAKVKFISFEPLLEFGSWWTSDLLSQSFQKAGVNWAIIGAQTPTSPKTAPKIDWIKSIVEAAGKAGVKVFLKNNLIRLMSETCQGKGLQSVRQFFTDDGDLRQEFPEVK